MINNNATLYYLVGKHEVMKKREFLGVLGKAVAFAPFIPATVHAGVFDPDRIVENPVTGDIWERVRNDYILKPEYINLESGYYNIIPQPTLRALYEHIQHVNREGSYYMRTVQWDNKKQVAGRLARLVNCPVQHLIITRNTTESLDMIIAGFPWEAGDEAIYALQDYGAMKEHFEMVSERFGIVNKVISVPNHPKSDDEIVSLYREQITPKTRLIMVCHMINITGQILPIRKICDMAHEHGVEVMVDGAHCVGHIKVDIRELGCDYYGSSLHKWLAAPLGCGILYVAPKHIDKIWPLLAEHDREPGDISRLNHTGTHPVHTDLSIANAMDYLEEIGLARKEERLRYLQRYWSEPLREVKNVVINTPKEPHRSCGIANVGITHMEPKDLAQTLLDEFGIFTVAIDYANVKGCRITPNVFTTTEELDQLIKAIKTLAGRG